MDLALARSVGSVPSKSYIRPLTVIYRELLFALVSVPLTSLVLSSLDLHKRRKCRLSPKRIIISASVTLMLLIVSIGLLGSCYCRLSLVADIRCPNVDRWGIREMWAIWYYYQEKIDLAPTVPFLASFNMIL
jgi:hypothetical protein